jgi:hypothetical protein
MTNNVNNHYFVYTDLDKNFNVRRYIINENSSNSTIENDANTPNNNISKLNVNDILNLNLNMNLNLNKNNINKGNFNIYNHHLNSNKKNNVGLKEIENVKTKKLNFI